MYARLWANLRPPFSAQFRPKVPQWALTDCQNVSLCTVVRVSMCEYFENITYFHLQIYSMPQADQITRGGQNWQCRQKNLSFTFCLYFVNCFFPCFYFLFFFFLQKWKLHKCLRFSNKKKSKIFSNINLHCPTNRCWCCCRCSLFAFCAISNGHETLTLVKY